MSLSGSIADRLEIHELYGRYASAGSRGDKEGWLACWADDAAWVSHIFECVGKTAIAKQYDAIMAAFDKLCFVSQIGPIEITGAAAQGLSTAMEIGHLKEGGLFKLTGNYTDKLEKRGSQWLFVRRDYQPLVQDF